MTRLTIVYTLNDNIQRRDAAQQLELTQKDLPEGACLQVTQRSAPGMDTKIRWVPFGDLVQFIDFVHARQAQEFDESEAYAAQQRRTKGFFSNVTFLSCTVIGDEAQIPRC